MSGTLDILTINGFKSIKKLDDFKLKNLNILIGGNGAGKSNFIDFFRMLRAMMHLSLPELPNSNLTNYILHGGGFDNFLFNGPKETKSIFVELMFGKNGYKFNLVPTASEDFYIDDESRLYSGGSSGWWNMGGGTTIPRLLAEKDATGLTGGKSIAYHVYSSIYSWYIYHFHDTSKTASVRRSANIYDNEYLRPDASNIAPFLLRLRDDHPNSYEDIIETIQMVTPFFDDFTLRIRKQGEHEKVNLEWQQQGSDYPMQPFHLSDGTLRFICLTTALLQPSPPGIIIIDEPELGLHPFALGILAEMIQSASTRSQIIIATQSAELVNYFSPEDVVVVNRKNGASTFNRLDSDDLGLWLEDYSLGQLWQKNVIAGGPDYE